MGKTWFSRAGISIT